MTAGVARLRPRWIELDAPPFTDGQQARLRYLLRQ